MSGSRPRPLRTRGVALGVLCLALCAACRAPHTADTDRADRTMDGKVYAGYQGWFATPDDGTRNGFDNYQAPTDGGLAFRPGASAIDLWPDLSEFDPDERYPTPFKHPDGSAAHVFSSAHAKTVDRHFRWMKAYGIDGVFLQRFAWMLDKPHTLRHRNRVMANVRASADRHGREWALMYDLTSVDDAHIRDHLFDDIREVLGDNDPRQSQNYIHHDGKPVIAIWGVGFADGRGYSLETCMELVRFLKHDPVCGGNAVMLGVPYYWREGKRDAVDDPLLHAILKQCDIVSPWSVGRYATPEQAGQTVRDQVQRDLAWARANRVGYVPVVFPGFSWHNLMKAHGKDAPLDQIPRLGGAFLWRQAAAAKDAGAQTIYIAMFDELNEGTAIMKCTNRPPVGESGFLTYHGLPSDHYLWLAGRVGRLLRNELPADAPLPRRQP
ncbi:MAG: glycoside hydrolase family 71/99-like protein [Phycisphaeraceae bacterium]